jgi:hypothetical protein
MRVEAHRGGRMGKGSVFPFELLAQSGNDAVCFVHGGRCTKDHPYHYSMPGNLRGTEVPRELSRCSNWRKAATDLRLETRAKAMMLGVQTLADLSQLVCGAKEAFLEIPIIPGWLIYRENPPLGKQIISCWQCGCELSDPRHLLVAYFHHMQRSNKAVADKTATLNDVHERTPVRDCP